MKKLVSIIILCLGCFGFLEAQDNIWRLLNCDTPFLGAASNGDLFAMDENGGLLRSQDEGETWTQVNDNSMHQCIAFSPEGRIFVFPTSNTCLQFSDDGGDTWQTTSTMASCAMYDVGGLCAPTNDIVVVWATNGETYWTTDGGETWNFAILEADDGSELSDMIVNAEGDVYVSVWSYSDGDTGIFHSTLSDMENWEIVAAEELNIRDMAFDPEGNVVACGYHIDGSSIGYQHTPGFYLFDGTTLAISDGGIVYRPHFDGNQAVLSYSTDHGEHFTDIGEHLPLVDIAPGGDAYFLIKGHDNHLYFDGGGEYWKCILDADEITNYGNYVPLVHEGNDRQKWNVVYILANDNYPNDYHTEIQSIRDNINLDGVDYKLVWTESVYDSKRIAGAVREEDRRVYYRRKLSQSYEEEVLLYDFNLTVGDTVTVNWFGQPLMVIEESEVEVNGTMRRKLVFGPDEYWIEGVGSSYGFLNSGYENWMGSFVHLLCYHENGDLVWDNEAFDECVMNSDGTPATFAPQGAEWYFDVFDPWSAHPEYERFYVDGDTIIQGHQCSIIKQRFVETGHDGEEYVYEEDNKVYWFNPTTNAFSTLYDFDAEAGESWYYEVGECSHLAIVDSVGSVTWNGHTYRTQWVRFNNDLPTYYSGKIIEGIGYERGLFPSIEVCNGWEVFDASEIDYLRCFVEDGEILYHEGDYDCDYVYVNTFCWDGTVADAYAGGDGTPENPYQIATSNQLALLAQQTNDSTGSDAYYELVANINLQRCDGGTTQWVSIGTVDNMFRGHFNGNGNYILNLNQTINNGNVQPVGGLFGVTDRAEIRNVNLVQCYVHGSAQYVGALVGYAGLTNISNCSIYDGCAETDNGTAGGLVGFAGYTYGVEEMSGSVYTIADCSVRGAVKVRGSACAGGIVGQTGDLYNKAFYLISNCSMLGTADYYYVQGGSTAGGIVGHMWYGKVKGCTNHQKVVGGTSTGGGCVGGIIGLLDYGTYGDISDCVNYGQVISADRSHSVNVGGIAGGTRGGMNYPGGHIRNCMNHADVTGTLTSGGIAGCIYSSNPSFVQNCHNYGRVTCNGPESAGGIIGGSGGRVNACYIVECSNFGDVVVNHQEEGDAGGILGQVRDIDQEIYILNVFNRGSVSAPQYAGGILGGVFDTRNCVIQNVYNTGEVITGEEIKGAIAYIQQENDRFSDCYWLDRENHAGLSVGEPLQHSCAFHPTESSTEWQLDSLQYGTTDLLEALNNRTEALMEQYPALSMVHHWQADADNVNDGYPVFGETAIYHHFAPQGAEWYFNVDGMMAVSPSYYHMEVLGDTVIQGHACSIITRQYYGGNGDEQYVYEENRVVYWYNQTLQAFTTLYDFNAEEGDTWICDIDSCSFEVQVELVEEITWGDHIYRVQHVVSESNEWDVSPFMGLIIEGIGYSKGLFPDPTACSTGIVCGPFPDYLRCYLVNGEMLYHEGAYDCDEYGLCWDGTVAEAYEGGDGTAENPYQIKTSEQLALLAQQTNDGTGGNAYYEMTANINLKDCLTGGGRPWGSIGTREHPFTGHFNGGGKIIMNLYQNFNDSDTQSIGGLFGYASNATLENVNVSNSTIEGVNFAGLIVGWAVNTTIMGCSVDGFISYSSNASCANGGVVGKVEVDYSTHIYIRNCINNATIQANIAGSSGGNVYYFGGIVGQAYVDDIWSNGNLYIVDCCNNGDLMGRGTIGGIAGDHEGIVENCDNFGQISSSGTSGGIVGYTEGMIKNCHNHSNGSVTGNCTGGIVGYSLGGWTLSCVNNAPVIGQFKHSSPSASNKAGGIIGYGDHIFNCYNTGDVAFTLGDNMDEDAIYVGGIGGNIDECKNSYNIGAVASSELQYARCGIIAGCFYDTKNVYWHGDYDLPIYGTGDAPEGSCAFRSGATATSWVLDEAQYGTVDLVEALNAGASEIESQYPRVGPMSRWDYDTEMANNGFPVFGDAIEVFVFNGSEWYYEIENEDGSITYQYLESSADTTVNNQTVTIIIRTNTLYDKSGHTEVTHEYIYEENEVVYWWNKDLQEFTVLYDLGAEVGDEWEIKVGTTSLVMHVDAVENIEYEGRTFKTLQVSDAQDLFSGTIVCGIGHLTSFFPERLMNHGKGYRVEGIRCYWRNGELVFKYGDKDCDEVYMEYHNGIEETDEVVFAVYPNPTDGVLYVETRHGTSLQTETYRITNIMGQTILTGSLNAETQQIDVSALPKGIYFITISGMTMKFMAQ